MKKHLYAVLRKLSQAKISLADAKNEVLTMQKNKGAKSKQFEKR